MTEQIININEVYKLLDVVYSNEEKQGTMCLTGRIGEDTDVSIFVSNIMNIICSRKETISRVQNWCRATEKDIEGLTLDVTVFDLLGTKFSIIIKSYMEEESK